MSLVKELRKNRSQFMEKIKDEVSRTSAPAKNVDERMWEPTKDKAGNALAVIRFLPSQSDEMPWVRLYTHGFQNPKNGLWYIENCPTTIGGECPLCEANTVLWNTGLEEDKTIVRSRKRWVGYITNILVINDPANPDNNGKVKLFRFGKKIFDKINSVMFPEFEDMEAFNPFDPWDGANFKLRVRKVEGYTNYDKSEFGAREVLNEDDDQLEELLSQTYNLSEFVEPSKFKSKEELSARLNKVLSSVVISEDSEPAEVDEDEVEESAPVEDEKPKSKVATKKQEPKKSNDDDDEIQEYLRQLAEE